MNGEVLSVWMQEVIAAELMKTMIRKKMYTQGRYIYGNSDQWRGAFGNFSGRRMMSKLFRNVEMGLDDRKEDDMDTARTMDLRKEYVHRLRYGEFGSTERMETG